MFNRKKRRHLDASSIIGQKTRVDGDVVFEGRLHVNGAIHGNVSAPGDDRAMLTLSETGSIHGDVRVPYIVLNGPVTGSVHPETISNLRPRLASKAMCTTPSSRWRWVPRSTANWFGLWPKRRPLSELRRPFQLPTRQIDAQPDYSRLL